MSKSDYILRMIEEISIIIAHIIGLKKENRLEESQSVLDDALTQFLGSNAKLAEVLEYRDLMQMISGNEEFNADKCMVLADLLKLKADIYESQGFSANANNLYIKSMHLFIEALSADNHLYTEKNMNSVNEMITLISIYELTDESKELFFKYYGLTGSYDKAEDFLYELLASTHYDSKVVNTGLAFYERLMTLDEAELLQGNLPITEVMEGYNELQKYK